MLLRDLVFPQAGKRPQVHGLLLEPISGRLSLARGPVALGTQVSVVQVFWGG